MARWASGEGRPSSNSRVPRWSTEEVQAGGSVSSRRSRAPRQLHRAPTGHTRQRMSRRRTCAGRPSSPRGSSRSRWTRARRATGEATAEEEGAAQLQRSFEEQCLTNWEFPRNKARLIVPTLVQHAACRTNSVPVAPAFGVAPPFPDKRRKRKQGMQDSLCAPVGSVLLHVQTPVCAFQQLDTLRNRH